MTPAEKLFIISGSKNAGKTTLCRSIVTAFQGRNITIRGVFSPAQEVNGRKTAILLHDLETGRQQVMARLRDNQTGTVDTIRWAFDPTVLAEGDAILKRSTPCDLLIIDELGPLEFQRGLGWQSGLKALDSGAFKAALVVIRPELLAQAKTRWPHAGVFIIEPLNREVQRTQLLEQLERLLI